MINLVNLLKKNKIIRIFSKKGETIRIDKRYIPLSKEWYNSLYTFNKNSIRFFPSVHDNVFKLLKRYFNMYSKYLETRINVREYRKAKRSLGNKVWVSTPEIKHLNEKIIITIYVYNRLYNQYKKLLDYYRFTWGPIINEKHLTKNKNLNQIIIKKSNVYIKLIHDIFVGTNNEIFNKNQDFYLKMIRWLKSDKFIKIQQYKLDIIDLIKNSNNKLLKGLNSLKIERYNYLINQFKLELLYLKLKQKMLFNQFKFNEVYLASLIDFLQIIYKKKIQLNIVVLKQHYLSSSILSQLVVAKAVSIKNRGRSTRPISFAMANTSIPNLSGNKLPRIDKYSIGMQNVILDQRINKKSKNDILNKFLFTNTKSKLWSSNYVDNYAGSNIENKNVAGIFIKIAGRLTKRYKAQRAVSVLKNRGTLKNVYSAHKGFSSVLSRGYTNINVEKTMIHSKIRIGAFGVTGWVASY